VRGNRKLSLPLAAISTDANASGSKATSVSRSVATKSGRAQQTKQPQDFQPDATASGSTVTRAENPTDANASGSDSDSAGNPPPRRRLPERSEEQQP
jgi:hypothetical protein